MLGGAGLGIFDHLCVPNIETGRIVRLLPDWTIPPLEINIVFPGKKIISPCVRVFVDFLKEIGVRDKL
jgi:LysR family transcriptional regulator, regulator for bpeEF and oprC